MHLLVFVKIFRGGTFFKIKIFRPEFRLLGTAQNMIQKTKKTTLETHARNGKQIKTQITMPIMNTNAGNVESVCL